MLKLKISILIFQEKLTFYIFSRWWQTNTAVVYTSIKPLGETNVSPPFGKKLKGGNFYFVNINL